VLAFSAFSGGRVEVRARAKVNLGLEVLGRRPDGYHELRSVMWAIELADRVTLETSGVGITLECAAPDVPRTPDNLAWRAAALVRQETGTAAGLRIRIEKRIPVAAGLGGGSTDAAAVLAGFRSLRRSGPGPRRLGAIAVALGMDVPFFLGRSPALAWGRGEEIRALRAGTGLSLVLIVGLSGLFAGAFGGGRVAPFAQGGVVAAPAYFAAGGTPGLMGERGAEAIMPLARGPDGRLGVVAQGAARPVAITVNIAAQNVESFRRSDAQISSALARAVARGQRNL